MRAARLLPLVAASLALIGCSDEGRMCTLIGCADGLTVQVTNAPAGPYRVEAYVGASPTTRYGHNCPGGPCTVFFQDFTPADVFIQVITPPDTTTRQMQPAYTVTRPNGEGCDPECRQATVNIAL